MTLIDLRRLTYLGNFCASAVRELMRRGVIERRPAAEGTRHLIYAAADDGAEEEV
jgi:hypothetical protein